MYSLDEIGLIPAAVSTVAHRGDVNPFVEASSEFSRWKRLPIFVSPMTCIIDKNNMKVFDRSLVEPILPVTKDSLPKRIVLNESSLWVGWTAVTLSEFEEHYCTSEVSYIPSVIKKVLIDTANGNMKSIFDLVKKAKTLNGKALQIMVGNIANPETYLECCKAEVDYVRVGIGGGGGCTTSVQTGIHTSIPYLLKEINDLKKFGYCSGYTKVIADGGIGSIDKAIKCLALGADYVMMGKAFAQCEEACGGVVETYDKSGNMTKKCLYYGQSSTQGQLDRFGKVKSNPEGTDYWVPVNTTLNEFTTKFEAALRSAMSYCNAMNLSEFIGKVRWERMSPSEFMAYNK